MKRRIKKSFPFALKSSHVTVSCKPKNQPSLALPSNFLCLEVNVVRMVWLLSSTNLSNSCLLCWPSFSSIAEVQQVYPWEQTRRCSPVGREKNTIQTGPIKTRFVKSQLKCDFPKHTEDIQVALRRLMVHISAGCDIFNYVRETDLHDLPLCVF